MSFEAAMAIGFRCGGRGSAVRNGRMVKTASCSVGSSNFCSGIGAYPVRRWRNGGGLDKTAAVLAVQNLEVSSNLSLVLLTRNVYRLSNELELITSHVNLFNLGNGYLTNYNCLRLVDS